MLKWWGLIKNGTSDCINIHPLPVTESVGSESGLQNLHLSVVLSLNASPSRPSRPSRAPPGSSQHGAGQRVTFLHLIMESPQWVSLQRRVMREWFHVEPCTGLKFRPQMLKPKLGPGPTSLWEFSAHPGPACFFTPLHNTAIKPVFNWLSSYLALLFFVW